MNLLALVQKTWRESGSGGRMPEAVTGLRGEQQRLVEWVWSADLFIQSLHTDWGYLWVQDTINTLAGVSVYAPPYGLGEPERDTFFIGDVQLELVDHIDVRHVPRNDTPGQPYRVIMLPNGTFYLEGRPDAAYDIRYSFYRQPTAMDIEDPEAQSIIPAAYREAIVGKALMLYAELENAPEIMQKGQTMMGNWVAAMEATQLPGERRAHRIAEGNVLDMYTE